MSVENADRVDFIGIDDIDGNIILAISDHLDWTDVRDHLEKLQEKLNTYLRFCESGELYESYPQALGRHVVFSLVAKHAIRPEGESFIAKDRTALERAGFGLRVSSPKSIDV